MSRFASQDPADQAAAHVRDILGLASGGAVQELAASAFTAAQGSKQDQYTAARTAVVGYLARTRQLPEITVGQLFDAAHGTPTRATAESAGVAARSIAAALPSGSVSFSQPSMLGASSRMVASAVATVLAALCGIALYFLDGRPASSDVALVGLTIGLTASLATALILVMGYGTVTVTVGSTDKG